jgi:hypothetical protein
MNNLSNKCLACGSNKCVRGCIQSREPETNYGAKFYPYDIDYFVLHPSIKLLKGEEFEACLDCGHVWNSVDPEKLKALLEKRGVPEGEVPKRKSLAAHYVKWVSLIIVIAVIIFWSASQ